MIDFSKLLVHISAKLHKWLFNIHRLRYSELRPRILLRADSQTARASLQGLFHPMLFEEHSFRFSVHVTEIQQTADSVKSAQIFKIWFELRFLSQATCHPVLVLNALDYQFTWDTTNSSQCKKNAQKFKFWFNF